MPSHKHRALLDEHVQHSSGWRSYTLYLGEVQENYLGGGFFRPSLAGLFIMLFFHPFSIHHLRTQQSRWADRLAKRFPASVAAPSSNNCRALPTS